MDGEPGVAGSLHEMGPGGRVMAHRRLVCLLLGALLYWGCWASNAAAVDLLSWVTRQHAGPAPSPASSTGRFPAVPPGKQPYYAYNVEDYPWYKHGCAVPTYNWGYFGARYRPLVVGGHSYYSTYGQVGFRPGD
jgi:hypothetical protein